MPTRLIALPIVLIALYLGFLIFEDARTDLVVYLMICLVILVTMYVLNPQINWFFLKKNPPRTPEASRQFLHKFNLFYRGLSPAMQRRFEQRFELYQLANDFIPSGFEKFPADIRAFVSAFAIQVSFGNPTYLTEPYNRIVAYPHPFPSPQYPENLHASEIEREEDDDGVLVLSAEQVIQVVTQPFKFYNIVLHEMTRIFMSLHPDLEWPELDEKVWDDMESISDMKRSFIEACIGRPDVRLLPVTLTLFFVFPWKFRAQRSDLYQEICRLFNLDPISQELPILDLTIAGPDH